MQRTRTSALSGLLAISLLATAACGGEEELPTAPLISSFTATPDEAEVGTGVTLAWSTSHASSVALTQDGEPVDLAGADAAVGSVTVTPLEGQHTFELTATGAEGTTPASASVVVTLLPAIPAPAVTDFTATPAEINAGDEATLAWTTTDGDSLRLVDGAGAVVFESTEAVASGSYGVSPEADATYTLTVTGPGGEATATATVTVAHPPVIDTFAVVDPAGQPILGSVMPGVTVSLEWETTNADTVSLVDGDGVALNAEGVDGAIELTAETSATYTLTATGPDGETAATAVLDVAAVVDGFTLTATGVAPTSEGIVVRSGDEVTASWTTRGAQAVTVTAPGGFTYTAPPEALAAGTVSFSAEGTGLVQLDLAPAGAISHAEVPLTLTEDPRVRSIAAAPDQLTAGHPVTVTWLADGATWVAIEADDGDEGHVLATDYVTPEAGTAELVLPSPGDWTVTVTAYNGSPTPHAASTAVSVVPAAVVDTFSVRPARVIAGDSVTIEWATRDAVETRLVTTVAEVPTPTVVTATGLDTRVVSQDTTFHFEAVNSLGDVVQSEPVTVRIGDPEVVSFSASAPYFHPGDDVTLSWDTLGGRTLVVEEILDPEPAVVHCSETDPAAIEKGSCQLTAPALEGTHTFRLRLLDGAVEVTRDATFEVIGGPAIRSFEASSEVVTQGMAVTFHMRVDPDVGGVPPVLTLTQTGGDLTAPVELPTPVEDPATGLYEVTVVLDEPGQFTFTLDATTPDTTGSSASLDIRVVPTPAIVSFETSDDHIDHDQGEQSATLTWATTTVTRVEVHGGGALLGTFTDPALVENGSLEVSPAETTLYRLWAFNDAGTKIEATALVRVDLPVIDTFVATGPQHSSADHGGHLDVLEGTPVDLTWTTSRTDRVAVSEGVQVGEQTWPYQDITTLPDTVILFEQGTEGQVEAGLSFEVTPPANYAPRFFGFESPSFMVHSDGRIDLARGSVYPFGQELESMEGSSIAWRTGLDHNGRYVLVQWHAWDLAGGDMGYELEGRVSFQAYLYRNGDLRFVYGDMRANMERYAEGYGATIGYDDPWHLTEEEEPTLHLIPKPVKLQDARKMDGGLKHRSWFLDFPTVAPNDALTYTPDYYPERDEIGKPINPIHGSTISPRNLVHLVAASGNGYEEAAVEVETWPDLAAIAPQEYWFREPNQLGDQVKGQFKVLGADHAELTANGETILVVDGDRQAGGVVSWDPPAPGTYTMQLAYSNPVSANVATIELVVFERLDVGSFTVNGGTSATIKGPGEVTLAWDTSAAERVMIVDDLFNEVLPSASLPATGTATVHLDTSASLRLYASDTVDFTGRVRVADVTVTVLDNYFTSFDTSATQVPLGGQVQLTWDGVAPSPDARVVMHPPTYSTETGVPYQSIAGQPGTRSLGASDSTHHTLDLSNVGFQVPFDGRQFDTFQVYANGWIAFGDMDGDPLSTFDSYDRPDTVPEGPPDTNPDLANESGFLSAYWNSYLQPQKEDADGNTTSQLLWRLSGVPGDRTLVVEWVDWRYGSSSSGGGTLNFQAVLHEDGAMEVRFGTMAPDPTASSSYHKYYLGYDALVGWEDTTDSEGVAVVLNEERPDLVAEGVVHYFPPTGLPTTGGVTVNPTENTTWELCMEAEGQAICETTSVTVVKPGDVLVTELMIQPTASEAEFLELRNVGSNPIDLSGWTLTDQAGAAVVLPSLPPLPPGDHLLVAASADAGAGLSPAATWEGSGFDLTDTSDTVTLTYGSLEVDAVTWDAGWTVTADRSLSLAPANFWTPGPEVNDLATAWCTPADAEAYGDGTLYGSPGMPGYGCDGGMYDLEPWPQDGFIDIADPANRLTAAEGNENLAQVPGGLGFTVPYWDQQWQDLWVSSNGWIWLGPGPYSDAEYYNRPLPTTSSYSPGGLIAPFWDDLNLSLHSDNQSAVYFTTLGVPGSRVAIVQWHELAFDTTTAGADASLTFQVQIHENGDIVFAYGELMIHPSKYSYMWDDDVRGARATIGIERPDQQDALLYSYDTDYAVESDMVLLFRRRP